MPDTIIFDDWREVSGVCDPIVLNPVMSQPGRKRDFLNRLRKPFTRSRSRSPNPKKADDETNRRAEGPIAAKSELDTPAITASISHVPSGQSPSTFKTVEDRIFQTLRSSVASAISKPSRSDSSHTEKVDAGSQRKLEASSSESDRRPITISSDTGGTATVDASDVGTTGATSNLTDPYAVITGTETTTAPSASKVVLKGLKKVLEVVERSSDMLPPLKTATAAILGVWDVVEVGLRLYSLPRLRAHRTSSRSKTKAT